MILSIRKHAAVALPCLLTSLLVAAANGGRTWTGGAPPPPKTRAAATHNTHASASFGSIIQPFTQQYCAGCHGANSPQAGLNLARFRTEADVRANIKTWQAVLDHLVVGDMPPREARQPADTQKRGVMTWIKHVLESDGKAHAGDPGSVPLRRLSNAEYNATIRDLTGVDLQPAREFPVDGAAGEGFTNAAEALTDVSPALLRKYLDAAKEISEHTVLLPNGFRFSYGKTRRDWTDESTAGLRKFYGRFAPSDGKLDIAPYVVASIKHRDAIIAGRETLEQAASEEHINANYFKALCAALNGTKPTFPLDSIRSIWHASTIESAPSVSAAIDAWRNALWQTVRVGSYIHPTLDGFRESTSRQVEVEPQISTEQPVRVALVTEPGKFSSDLYLQAASSKSGGEATLWKNPRFIGPGESPLPLRDYAKYRVRALADYNAELKRSGEYLQGVVSTVNGTDASAGDAAKRLHLNSEILQRWINLVGLRPFRSSNVADFPGRPFEAVPLEVMSHPIKNSNNLAAINGWHGDAGDLPAAMSNASDALEHIPGDAAPHSIIVHPSPQQFVAAVWNSPISGSVSVAANVKHAHPSCGNGVAFWLEHRRGRQAAMWSEGRLELGAETTPASQLLHVEKGDQILLAVDAKDGDHSCDLTRIRLHIESKETNGHTWDLASDVAGSILAGNPHVDAAGNVGVWSFVVGPTRHVNASTEQAIPAGSELDTWKLAAQEAARSPELAALQGRVADLLSGSVPGDNSPNAKLWTLLVNVDGPLFKGVDAASMSSAPGSDSSMQDLISHLTPNGDLELPANRPLHFTIPAGLAAGRTFAAEGTPGADEKSGVILYQATSKPAAAAVWDGKSPIAVPKGGARAAAVADGCREFRSLFPLYTCYPAVIPNDEVVSLKMFHREDEPLKRLFLTAEQNATLDRLWAQHLFISRQPAAENKYLPLFIGFVTQDQPKEMVSFFEGQRPAFQKRSDLFEKGELAAEPSQIAALVDFAARAYRRPLTSSEKAEIDQLYRAIRAKGAPHDEAMRGVVARILVAPSLLFRIENAAPGARPAPVNDNELATRISYFLWSTMPDEELRAAAASGTLHRPEVLNAQCKRMLKDDRIRTLAIEFGAQMLHVRGFDNISEKNEKLFPMFTPELRKDIYEETILFFKDLFQQDRPGSRILDADYTYLNGSLAKHYGIPGIEGDAWRRVEGVQKYGRGGVLGLATFLTQESGASRTSPILRGNWVSETLLGERLPRPPKNVPKLPEEEGTDGLTIRQQVELHSKNPMCYSCHRRIDPFGYSLERYDPIGRYREKDMSGKPLDDSAKLNDGTRFLGMAGLRNYLRTTRGEQVLRLFYRKLVGYALGRSVINSDQALIDRIMFQTQKTGKISSAVIEIVNSPQFRNVRGQETQKLSAPQSRRITMVEKRSIR